MENKERSIREWQTAYAAGEFNSPDVTTQINAGWYDWFCSDESLARRTKRLATFARKFKTCNKFDIDSNYIFFKNCCPLFGSTYDRVSICDMKTGDVKFCIDNDKRMGDGTWNLYGTANDFSEPLCSGSAKEILTYLHS